jgi:hypothetical protein
MRRLSSLFLITAIGLATPVLAEAPKEKVAAKGDKKKAPAKKAPPKKSVVVNAENKKKLAVNMRGFKFGMSKDEVVAMLGKQIDERYEEKIKATTDVAAQDRLRKDKRKEITVINSSYLSFEGKRTGWDVSIVEGEFAHNTGESMLEMWENQDGKNQRRFFFFHDGKLWKMFISLDVSILPADQKNFATFQNKMQGAYGPGDVETDTITWKTDDFVVRAIDKLKSYDALGLVIEDPRVGKDLIALREAKAPPKAETSAVIKAVIDPDKTDKPDVKGRNDAVDAVINAHGGASEPKKQ